MSTSNGHACGRADGCPDTQGLFVTSLLLALLALPARAELTYSPPHLVESGNNPHALALADLNADGRPDLAVANFGSNTVSVWMGKGAGTFADRNDYGTGDAPNSIAVADLNGDGHTDLVVTNAGSNTISVLLGNGAGAFGSRTDFETGINPISVLSADLNGDGRADLLVANLGSNSVSVLLGNGDGTFGARTDFGAGNTPRALALADLDADGRLDLAVADQYDIPVSLLHGNGDGTFAPRTLLDFATRNPSSVAIADINGDGRLDLAVAGGGYDVVTVLLGNGDGTFGFSSEIGAGLNPVALAIADFNFDGRPDLATANVMSNSVTLMLQNADGTFAPEPVLFTEEFPTGLAVADLNGDGRPDLAAANNLSNSVSLFVSTSSTVGVAIELTPRSLRLGPPRHPAIGFPAPPLPFAGSRHSTWTPPRDPPRGLRFASDRWVTAFLEPATPFAARDIDVSSVRLNGTVRVDPAAPPVLADHNHNGVPDLMMRFSLAAFESTLTAGSAVEVTVSGLVAGRSFVGTDHIQVLRPIQLFPTAAARGPDNTESHDGSADFAIRAAAAGPATGGRLRVQFALPERGAVRLQLFDVAGRALFSTQLGPLGPGVHTLDLAEGVALQSGIYFVRLGQDGNEVHARAEVIR